MFHILNATPEEVQRVVEGKIFPAVDGEQTDHVILALIATCAMIMKPELTPDDLAAALQAGVHAISLALLDPEDTPGVH